MIQLTTYKRLLKTIEEIESLFPLKYSEKINLLFNQLQELLTHFPTLPTDIISRLQIIWSYRGYSMEKHFAIKKDYRNFDFYPKYKKLLAFDSYYLRKMIEGKKYHKVIFIGSGALPLSLKLIRLNIPKVGYDISEEALKLAQKTVPKDRFGRKIIYKKADFFHFIIKEKRPVIVYIAGLIKNKKIGIKSLAKQLPKNSLIVIRTVANDKRGFLYEKIDKKPLYRIGQVKEFIPTKNSGIINGMIVLKI